jgi:hypothetical protein
MSWGDNITIGKGNKGCSAILCFQIEGEHCISENSVLYWIHDLIFNFSMTIFKDTKEGKKLKDYIDKKTDLAKIIDYLNTLVLRKIKLSDLQEEIEKVKSESYLLGKTDMKNEFRNLLGLDSDYY